MEYVKMKNEITTSRSAWNIFSGILSPSIGSQLLSQTKVSVLTDTTVSAYNIHATFRMFVEKKNCPSWIISQIKGLIYERKPGNSPKELAAATLVLALIFNIECNAKFSFFKSKLSEASSSADLWKTLSELGLSKL